jgi:hypothetical protein
MLSVLSREYLKQLRAEGGKPTDEEIVTIYELGRQASQVFESSLLLFQYKMVGNLRVYPLTIGAKLWLEDARRWWENDPAMDTLAVVYASSHSREPERFQFDSARQAKRHILKEMKRLNVTEDELAEVLSVQNRLENGEPKERQKESLSFIPYLSLLMRHYGKDVDYWLWSVTDDIASDMIKEIAKQEGNQQAADAVDPQIQAAVKVKLLCNQILAREE